MESKQEQVLQALKGGQRLSGLDIWRKFGAYRAAVIIQRLRQAGHDIKTEVVREGKTMYAVYFMTFLLLFAAPVLSQDVHRFIADEVTESLRADSIEVSEGNINVLTAYLPNVHQDEVARRVNMVFSTHFTIFDKYAELTGRELNVKDSRRTWRKDEGVQLIANVDGKVMLIGFDNKTNKLIIIW